MSHIYHVLLNAFWVFLLANMVVSEQWYLLVNRFPNEHQLTRLSSLTMGFRGFPLHLSRSSPIQVWLLATGSPYPKVFQGAPSFHHAELSSRANIVSEIKCNQFDLALLFFNNLDIIYNDLYCEEYYYWLYVVYVVMCMINWTSASWSST